jgi:hypothetical protein
MAGSNERPRYATGERVWLVLHTGVGGRTPAVTLTIGPSRLRVRYQHPGTPSRAAHPAERWVSVAELAPRTEGDPIDIGYVAVSVTDRPLDVLSDDPPHPDEGPWWPLRVVQHDGSSHEDAMHAWAQAQAMECAWWNWPNAARIEPLGDSPLEGGPATRVTGRAVAGDDVEPAGGVS